MKSSRGAQNGVREVVIRSRYTPATATSVLPMTPPTPIRSPGPTPSAVAVTSASQTPSPFAPSIFST